MSIAPQVLILICFTFVHYFTLGIAIVVIPMYLYGSLGMSAFSAGLVTSMQFMATFLSRPFIGRLMDHLGPRTIVIGGLLLDTLSGLLLFASTWFPAAGWLSMCLLLLSRILHGVGESSVGNSVIIWGIMRVGPLLTGNMIAFNGIATYSAIALGAPAGAWLLSQGGLAGTGAFILIVSLMTAAIAFTRACSPVTPGERAPFLRVFARIYPAGMAMMLSTTGFGTIATFVSLFYADKQWEHAAYAVTAFGFSFVGTRLFFANAINRQGGYKVAIISSCVEAAGLLLIWLASSPAMAMAGASLSGFGLSLIFPALAVEAVRQIPAHQRGSALSAFTIFQDLAIGFAGPVAGYIAGLFSYADAFLFSAILTMVSVAITVLLYRQQPRTSASH